MVDADGALVAAVWGPLPHQLPVQRSIARAELQAVERALAHAVPPIVLHIDRQSILDGIAAGRAWCVCAARPDADLWMAVWRRIDDLGLGPTGVLFQKTKAHRSEAALQRLEAGELRIARANAEADRLAGQGASEGTNSFLEHIHEACAAEEERIGFVLNYVAELTERVYEAHGGWPDVGKLPGPAPPPPPQLELVPDPSERHDLRRRQGGGWECRRCRRHAAQYRTLEVERCPGSAAARLVVDVGSAGLSSRGNWLWRTADVVWCCLCGQSTARRLAGLRAHTVPAGLRTRPCSPT